MLIWWENTRKQEWKCQIYVLLRKGTFWPGLTLILGLEETETHFWKRLLMAHSNNFNWRYLNPKNFKFHAGNQKCQIRNCQFGTLDSLHGIWNFLGPNTFIWSLLNMPLVNFFKNVSQFLPNPGFRSIQVKKCLFWKGHIFCIFILVSLWSPIMLASFKRNVLNVFCPPSFLHF